MPYPNINLPTYADLGPQVVAWAAARELVCEDGRPLRANPLSQHRKTVEEIGGANEALAELNSTKALAVDMMGKDYTLAAQCMGDGPRRDLALELGDILVTLTIQSAMHGKALGQCKAESGRLTTGYGSDWYLGKVGHPPKTWAYVDEWAALLGDALANLDSPHRFDIAGLIGAVAICVEDAARIELAMLGPECLALALVKIEGRQGEMVNGVFVKDEECDAA